MDNIVAVGTGLGLRAIIDYVAHRSYSASAIVGVWEGVVLNHFLAKYPTSVDPYVAFAFRLFVDYLFTQSMSRMVIVLLWTFLGMLLSDVAIEMSEDRRFRRFARRARRVPPLSWFPPPSRLRSSRVRFNPTSAGARTARRTAATPTQIPAVRPTVHPIPGGFDQYSEVSVPTATGNSETPSELDVHLEQRSPIPPRPRTPSELDVHLEQRSPIPPRPRTPSELEYIDPLPVIPDTHDQVDFDPRRQTIPMNPRGIFSLDDTDAPSIHSGMTTPVNDPLSLSRPLNDEDRPLIHSGLTTPENLRAPMQAHTEGLPPVAMYDVGDQPLADLPDQAPVPIRLVLVDQSPPAHAISMPEPQLAPTTIPPTSDIPNIPTPDDLPPDRDEAQGTPPPSFAEATGVHDADVDLESHIGEGSVISVTGGKNIIIAKADELRKQALAEEKKRDALNAARKQAVAENRYIDVLKLELDYEAAHETAAQLHAKAARRYFRAHNLNPPPQEVDVHRLKVPEAISQVRHALKEAFDMNASELRVITGRGNHSKNRIPVLKLNIIQEMSKYHLSADPDSKNDGVLVIRWPVAGKSTK